METEAMRTIPIVQLEIDEKGSIKKRALEDLDFLTTPIFKGEKLFSTSGTKFKIILKVKGLNKSCFIKSGLLNQLLRAAPACLKEIIQADNFVHGRDSGEGRAGPGYPIQTWCGFLSDTSKNKMHMI